METREKHYLQQLCRRRHRRLHRQSATTEATIDNFYLVLLLVRPPPLSFCISSSALPLAPSKANKQKTADRW